MRFPEMSGQAGERSLAGGVTASLDKRWAALVSSVDRHALRSLMYLVKVDPIARTWLLIHPRRSLR
jgi:hypothetical protein